VVAVGQERQPGHRQVLVGLGDREGDRPPSLVGLKLGQVFKPEGRRPGAGMAMAAVSSRRWASQQVP
jgi:hypothetical protein